MFAALACPPSPPAGALLDLARGFAPRVEEAGPALVLIDLAGLGRLWPDPRALGEALLEAGTARNLALQVALAHTRTAAGLLARAVPGLTIIVPGGEATALAPLPLELLGLPPEQHELLRLWGLRTLGQLAALPARGLAERLGPGGPRLRRLARGEDERPLAPALPPESFELNLDLEWPVDGLEPLAFLLQRLLEPLCAQLVQRGRRAAALELELRLVDGRRHARRLAPPAPSADPRTWRTLLILDLEAHPPGEAARALCVRAEPTAARRVQFSLLDPAQPAPEALAETLGRLSAWTTAGRGGSPRLLDSHRPGAYALSTFNPPEARDAARPEQLLTPGRVALRAFRPPLPAEVTLQAGVPRFISAAGLHGPVLDCAGPWRVSGDWWDEAWARDEWDVALPAGLFRIFRDRLQDGWYVEGELD